MPVVEKWKYQQLAREKKNMLPFQPARACKEYQLNHAGVIQRKKTDVIVAIGGSTGSPKIVEKIISHLPADLPAAIMVSLHMPAGFT
ncbi:MAG: hypothetical protein GX878_08025, partial [Firmicutes bacterium]|nr:hypothetical protein [Bacillota bacterium]